MYLYIFVIKFALLLFLAVKPAYPASCSIKEDVNTILWIADDDSKVRLGKGSQ